MDTTLHSLPRSRGPLRLRGSQPPGMDLVPGPREGAAPEAIAPDPRAQAYLWLSLGACRARARRADAA